ncbi:MAG: fibronectin type III domain-containing protein [Burkholderiales bacterium]|nr:fibronectin type III domain-containing protein [Burkholderiales bacterium]
MSKRFNFQPKPVSKAAGMLVALMAASTGLQAGSGFVDTQDPAGVAYRLQTYFAYSPSGTRDTTVPEEDTYGLAAAAGRTANFTGKALRKFIDPLPLPGKANAKLMADGSTSKYIPVAQVSFWTNPQGVVTTDQYYEIAVIEYTDRFHTDLIKPTVLRGYVQIDHLATNGLGQLPGSIANPLTYPDGSPIMIAKTDAAGKIIKDGAGAPVMVQALSVDTPHYLGPVIAATRHIPTRVKFMNLLPAGRIEFDANGVKDRHGDLFLPVDSMLMGAGFGPDGMTQYTQNRANVHLHGGDTPWISDGTPHQWLTPAAEADPTRVTVDGAPLSLAAEFAQDPARDPALLPEFLRGASTQNVPDMNDPGLGAWTLYFPNEQTARMLWYHDHSVGITRLNVYAGMASAYLLTDTTEQNMVSTSVLPPAERTIPLVLQDRTFVPDDINLQDGLWDTKAWGAPGDSWFPHVYETVQDPLQVDNTNAVGRWHYGPYFWPVFPALYPLPTGAYGDVTTTPEAWMDTPIVNGVAYPVLEVDPTTYRFRILNATNDRMLTFNLLKAVQNPTLGDGTTVLVNPRLVEAGFDLNTEVDMVPAAPATPETACPPIAVDQPATRPTPLFNTNGSPKLNAQNKQMYCQPDAWPIDGRLGGMPDPNSVGPALHQIASEGGWLPAVHSIEPNPMTYLLDKGRINVFNANTPSLFMGPAERADVVVDFSQYAGKTLLVYNDSGAPIPAGDPRNDVFTGVGDQSGAGGAEDTKPGYGPNIRTFMQIKVKDLPVGTTATAFETDGRLATLKTSVSSAFIQDQEKPVVAQPAYAGFDPAWANLTQDQSYARIQTGSLKEPVFKYTPGTPSASINSVTVTEQGTGYTAAPLVTISAPLDVNGRAASAKATLKIDKLTLTAAGSGFVVAPNVTIVGGGGNGAVAEAVLGADAVQITAGGTGYGAAPTVTFTQPPAGGRRATGTATINGSGQVTGVTITDPGTGYTATPLVSFTPVAGGTGARATTTSRVTELHLTPADPMNPASAGGGGFTSFDPAALVNPFNINFLGGGGRVGVPVVLPTAVATGKVFDITLDYAGRGYVAEVPTVTVGASPNGVTALAQSDMAAGTATGSNLVKTKAIHELFDATYGRLNSILAVELPFTSAMTQTTIPLAYLDAPTEIFSEGETQIWKITHNGVDSHPVHFHLLNVQLVNRVDWAGIMMPPDKNELGWKETVRMNPLEDVIVAVRASTPKLQGFGVPLSVRAMDPAQPLGSPFGFTQVDTITGTPKTVVNDIMNFGWEYVWHCHILGHEENDFMRPVVFNAGELTPVAPVIGAAVADLGAATPSVTINWTEALASQGVNSEVGFRVQRGTTGSGVFEDLTPDLHSIVGLNGQVNALANAQSYVDTTIGGVAGGGGGALPATPNTPTTVVAANAITVNWTVPANLPGNAQTVGFKVLRANVDSVGVVGPFTVLNPLAQVPANVYTYTDGTVLSGEKYQYQVQALAAGGDSVDYRVVAVNVVGETASAPVTVALGGAAATQVSSAASATAAVPMLAPTSVGAAMTAAVAQVTYSWTGPANAAGYTVRYRVGNTAALSAPLAASPYVPQVGNSIVAPVGTNQWVTFQVKAVSASGVESPVLSSGAIQKATPTVPTGLSVTGATPTALTFNWAVRPNAVSYTVQYSTTSGFTAATTTTVAGVATNSYTPVLLPNTRYYFRVRAVNTIGTSGNSATVKAWTLANAVVDAPVVSTAGVVAGTQVKLNWVASVGGASSYVVQQSSNGGGSWTNSTVIAQVPATPTGVTVTGLAGQTAYKFRVLARNGANVAAAPSAVADTVTLLAEPTAITAANGISGGLVTGGLNFTSNNGGAVTYELRYGVNQAELDAVVYPTQVVPGQQVAVTGAAGNRLMQVRSVDAEGNTSLWVPAAPVTVRVR